MSKIRIEDIKCFDQVASVIGKRDAKLELFKVSQSLTDNNQTYLFNTETFKCELLEDAFEWQATPQGKSFWDNIFTTTYEDYNANS